MITITILNGKASALFGSWWHSRHNKIREVQIFMQKWWLHERLASMKITNELKKQGPFHLHAQLIGQIVLFACHFLRFLNNTAIKTILWLYFWLFKHNFWGDFFSCTFYLYLFIVDFSTSQRASKRIICPIRIIFSWQSRPKCSFIFLNLNPKHKW